MKNKVFPLLAGRHQRVNRGLTKPRRRRQRERHKTIDLMSKTTTLHGITLFCTFLCCPSTTTTWNDKILSFLWNGKGKAINSTISVWIRARSLLVSCKLNSRLLSNWAPWNSLEKKWKDIFQQHFQGRHRCRIVRSLISPSYTKRNLHILSFFPNNY